MYIAQNLYILSIKINLIVTKAIEYNLCLLITYFNSFTNVID